MGLSAARRFATVAAIRALGQVARTRRPRGRHVLASAMHSRVPDLELEYRDAWGHRHVADFSDPMEALGFVGKPSLPPPVASLIRRGDWTIDVGANVGIVTSQLCALVGPSGRVWAFEPFPRNVGRLDQLKSTNGLGQLTIFPGALSSRSGDAVLNVPNDHNSGHPSLSKVSDIDHRMSVRTWSLDEIVSRESPSEPLRFVKIDVEGHEPAVLAGASLTLATHRPSLLCEMNDELLREGGSSSSLLLEQLADAGYRPVWAIREGRPIMRVDGGRLDLRRFAGLVVDLLLVPR